ncbi:hypothetical protein CC1G_14273 [Coprinopsis cinerea okayama7|uniref:Uncharacterized protein n=1 Tax=Coprinopsis cinerea (strain Okayama-7 / 130 / ATCC MYA-4618 / FGSC 9003) TaxID=240176 RepID=D6RLR5_COPC7|nr:hypothetical protein CC1G_14273 [Coprinopsis cinerea okayama7\|eukprot:XP_002911742.1 hypothetical protein CC1G_14273 [Coprinopsis cinerea okayama7\
MAQSVLSQTHHDKVTEAEGSVLDIARQSSSSGHQDVGDIEVELGMGAHRDIGRRGSRAGDSGRREGSGKSSFSRWRLQASTQFARESLGIQFRHSDDTNEKHRTYENTIESESDPLSSSSRSSPRFRPSLMIRKPGFLRSSQNGRVGANGNGNGGAGNGNGNGNVDRRVSDYRSWSPNYQINLPFQPPSGQGALSAAQATSTAGSLSYLTAPTTTGHHEAELSESYPVAPPSYAASVLTNGGESPLSVPRSVGQSSYPTSGPVASTHPPAKGKRKSDDLLSSPNQTSGGNKTSPDTFSSDLTPPFPIRDLSKEDRGSIYDQSIDEDPKVLGGSAVRQVLRSLSPRTSKASFLPRRSFIHGHSRREASSSLEMEPMRSPTEQRPTSSAPPPPLPSPNTQASLSAAQARHESRPLPPIPQHPTINSPPPTPSQPTEPQRPEASQTTFKLTPPSASASTRFIVTPQRSNSDDSAWPSSQIASTRFSYSSGSNLHGSSPLVPDSASPPVSGGGRQSARFSALPKLPPDTAQGPSMSRRTFRLTPASFIPFPRQDPSRPSTSGTGAGTGIAGPSTGVSSTGGPTTTADDHHLHVRDSFIDFTVSSDVSTISNNGFVTDTSSAQDVRRYSTPPQMHPALPEERSRWSSSNSAGVSVGDEGRGVQFEGGFGGLGNGKGNGNSNGDGENKSPTSGGESSSSGGTQRSTRSTTFPIPVQISIPRNSQFLSPHRQVRLSTSGSSSRSDPVHVHPMMENLESPTDSIPISASDVNFTYSDDEPLPAIAQGRSRAFMDRDSVLVGPMSPFRAVPPSPSTEQHHGTHESDEAAVGPPTPLPTGLSSPNYIVQRVLGLSSPASSVTARPPGPSSQSHSHSHSQLDLHSRSRSGSTSAFFNTPLSARFETSLKGSSDPDIPRTF